MGLADPSACPNCTANPIAGGMISGMNQQTTVDLIAGQNALMAKLRELRQEEFYQSVNVRRVAISKTLWEHIGLPLFLEGFSITPNPELEPTQFMVIKRRDLPREFLEQ